MVHLFPLPMHRDRTSPDSGGDGRGGKRCGLLLLHPHPVVREALALLLETQDDFKVLIEAGTWSELARGLGTLRRRIGLVAIVSLDLGSVHDAYESIATCRQQFPMIRVLAIGAGAERLAISRALFVGADGFVDHRAEAPAFLDAIRRCSGGEMVLEGVPLDWLGTIASGVEQQASVSSPLTEREREVLTVAAQGLRARDIAEELGVTERTVTTHLARIYEKLGVNSRLAAVVSASRSGILRLVPGPYEDRARVG